MQLAHGRSQTIMHVGAIVPHPPPQPNACNSFRSDYLTTIIAIIIVVVCTTTGQFSLSNHTRKCGISSRLRDKETVCTVCKLSPSLAA